MWFVFALLSAIFAALTSILAKVGISEVNSNLATAIRTVVVVAMSWGMVFLTQAQSGLSSINGCVITKLFSLEKHPRLYPSTSLALSLL